VDLALVTANVAQVLVSDEAWAEALHDIRGVLRAGGHLVFEVREPAARGWVAWTRELARQTVETREGLVDCCVELTEAALPFVSFRDRPGRELGFVVRSSATG
jgi:hypothetical protein